MYSHKNRGQSQNRSCIIFPCLNCTNITWIQFFLRLRPLYFAYTMKKKNINNVLIFSLYCLGLRIGSKPERKHHHFFMLELHQHNVALVLAPAQTSMLWPTVYSEKSNILYQFSIFFLYMPKYRGQSQNWSHITFHARNSTNMMRL
jgi:hypothetical protein